MDLNWNQGARYLGDERTRFRLWAPAVRGVEVKLLASGERRVPLQPTGNGYHEAVVEGVRPGDAYLYVLDSETERPDPASRYQPDGVHGPSRVVESAFSWKQERWTGIPLDEYVFYELHVGTFSPEGTFDGVIPYLPYLRELGVTCIELMPIAQFPGSRNWGYDGVYPYAAQASYGGPEGLKRLVDAAHSHQLAVCLDVVYNHLGPEGNYLSNFGPYFTEAYRTPWGCSLNYDGPSSDEVRRYFIGNALYWVEECRIDALRLDAVHAIIDVSAQPFLRELAEAVHQAGARLGRRIHVIAENDRNDPAFARPAAAGGMGMDSQWSDDFHHALHTVLTGERQGYYSDFGSLEQLARAYSGGYVYAGEYAPHRGHRHGAPAGDLEGVRFVVCCQNHDQVGNRMLGDRLASLVDFPRLKLAAAAVLLSPYLPLLFMGEEYGESAPFLYFVSHGDPGLVEAVRKGRRDEFAAFHAHGEAPDPQAESTFEESRLRHERRSSEPGQTLLAFYKELLRLRREVPALAALARTRTTTVADETNQTLSVTRCTEDGQPAAITCLNFGDAEAAVSLESVPGNWKVLLDSEHPRWAGRGAGREGETLAGGTRPLLLPPASVILLVPV